MESSNICNFKLSADSFSKKKEGIFADTALVRVSQHFPKDSAGDSHRAKKPNIRASWCPTTLFPVGRDSHKHTLLCFCSRVKTARPLQRCIVADLGIVFLEARVL